MGFDFKNGSNKEFRLNSSGWPEVMNLAIFFGWEPKGTYLQYYSVRVPDGLDISDEEYIRKNQESWDGSYTDNEGQLVTENDAFNLAFALMKAVKVLSDETLTEFFQTWCSFEHKNEKFVEIYNWSDEEHKNILKDFICFCMDGEFDIR